MTELKVYKPTGQLHSSSDTSILCLNSSMHTHSLRQRSFSSSVCFQKKRESDVVEETVPDVGANVSESEKSIGFAVKASEFEHTYVLHTYAETPTLEPQNRWT